MPTKRLDEAILRNTFFNAKLSAEPVDLDDVDIEDVMEPKIRWSNKT